MAHSSQQSFKGECYTLLVSHIASTDVQHDPIEPALETLLIPELVQREISRQPCLLNKLACNLILPNHPLSNTQRHRLIPRQQFAERLLVPGTSQSDQFTVRLFLHDSSLVCA